MKVLIDGAEIGSRKALHAYLQQALVLPGYYGRNLDALYDCLTDVAEPTEIVLKNAEQLEQRLGFYTKSLMLVLRRAAQENNNLTITVEP